MTSHFLTQVARKLDGVELVDGVSKLQSVVGLIDEELAQLDSGLPGNDLAIKELSALKQRYVGFLDKSQEMKRDGLQRLMAWKRAREEVPKADSTKTPPPTPAESSAALYSSFATADDASAAMDSMTVTGTELAVLESLQTENSTLRRRIDELEADTHELNSLLLEYKTKDVSHASATASDKREAKRLALELELLRAEEIEPMRRECQLMKERNSALNQDNAELRQALMEAQSANASMHETIDSQKRKIAQLTEIDSIRAKQIDQMQAELRSQSQSETHTQRTCVAVASDLSSMEATAAALSALRESSEKQAADLKRELAESTRKCQVLESQLRSSKTATAFADTRVGMIASQKRGEEEEDSGAVVEDVVKDESVVCLKRNWVRQIEETLGQLRDITQSSMRAAAAGSSSVPPTMSVVSSMVSALCELFDPILVATMTVSALPPMSGGVGTAAMGGGLPLASGSGMRSQGYDELMRRLTEAEDVCEDLYNENEALRQRLTETAEEKSTMMRTLKQHIEALATSNESMRRESSTEVRTMAAISEQKLRNEVSELRTQLGDCSIAIGKLERKCAQLSANNTSLKGSVEWLTRHKEKLSFDLNERMQAIDKVNDLNEALARDLRENELVLEQLMLQKSALTLKLSAKTKEKESDAVVDDMAIGTVVSDERKMADGSVDHAQTVAQLTGRYEVLLEEKNELQQVADESEGKLSELTHEIIELENELSEVEQKFQLVKDELAAVQATAGASQTQRVAVSIAPTADSGADEDLNAMLRRQSADSRQGSGRLPQGDARRDMFGLRPAPAPDVLTSVFKTFLPFLDDAERPRVV